MAVTYYKLEQRYEGDVTKGCGLTSAQVDENFHFLRGYDIKSADFKDGILKLTRVNCDEIIVSGIAEYVKSVAKGTMDEYDEPFRLDGSSFDPETGILTIFVNGNPYQVSGFLTNDNFRIYVGYGLDGQGTIADPVRVSHINDTGFYAPVEKVIDYEQGETLPDMSSESGDKAKRYITREATSPYGLIYSYEAIDRISRILDSEGHGWRVPTFNDWAMMLNGQEDCEGDYLNHGNTNESSINGMLAGQKLKDYSWNEETQGENSLDVLPIQIEYFPRSGETQTASFWADTVSSADTHVYGKRFIKGISGVETLGSQINNSYLAIRLVRDAGWGNESEVEVINGVPYHVETMSTWKRNENNHVVLGTAEWTKENVSFPEFLNDGSDSAREPFGEGFVLPDEAAYKATENWNYYINYYDPFDEKWIKKQLGENEIVMVHDFEGNEDVEVIVKKNDDGEPELRLRSEELFEDIKGYVDAAVESEKNERMDADADIWETIGDLTLEVSAVTQEFREKDEELQGQIDDANERIDDVNDRVTEIETIVESGYTVLEDEIQAVSDRLDEEAETREKNDVKPDTKTVSLGDVSNHGLKVYSNDEEPLLNISFDLDMGEISISTGE